MNPNLEAFLIAAGCTVVGVAFVGLMAILATAIQPVHPADAPAGEELDIPADREFTEPAPREADYLGTDYTPCTPFPHDTDYDAAPAKRF